MNLKQLTTHHNLPKQLLDTVPALVWASDSDKKCFYFNKSWLKFTGRSLKAELGDGWLENVHPEDSKATMQAYEKYFDARKPYTIEYRLRRKDGEFRWVLSTATPWIAKDGTFYGYIGSCVDITERKQAAETQAYLGKASEVLSSSLDYRTTLKSIAKLAVPKFADWCAVEIIEANGKLKQVTLTHVDPAKVKWAKALSQEYPPPPNEESVSQRVARTGKPEWASRIPQETLLAAARDERHKELILSLELKSYMSVPMKVHDHVVGVISFLTTGNSRFYTEEDLRSAEELANYAALAVENSRLYTTARKELEERVKTADSLQKSEEKFRHLADSGLIAVVFFGLHDRIITDANPAFLRLLGYSRTDLKKGHMNWDTINPPEWRGADMEAYRQLQSSGVFPTYEKELIRKDGTRVPVLIGGSLFATSKDQGVVFFLDISDRKKNELALQHRALHDELTNLPNRTLLHDRLQHAIQMAARHKQQCAILFLDLDHFKNVNDTLGHHAGDTLLEEVAHRLKTVIREEDTLARFGGDEFVIVANDIHNQDEAVNIANKVFAILQEPFLVHEREIYLNTSIGISLYPENGKDEHTLIKNADIALYQAKESGRQGYAFFNVQDRWKSGKSLDLEGEMRMALKKEQFEMYYQPIMEIVDGQETGRVVGTEALVRWNHPKKGLLLPGSFIPYAEDSGLIYQIGKWILNQVCEQICKWENEGMRYLKTSINLSPLQFYRKDFLTEFQDALRDTGIQPSNLIVEITENLALRNIEVAIAKLHALKDLGVEIAIDDFGVGHSSLNYLKRLPIDKLKIDRSFVQASPYEPADSAIIQAVGTLARHLNLAVVAEGVETREQLQHLCDIGCCDEMQGFYFSRPLPAHEFATYAQRTSYWVNPNKLKTR